MPIYCNIMISFVKQYYKYNMNKIKILTIGVILSITMFSFYPCSSDNDELSEETRYYVKYEVEAYTQHINVPKKITFITESGTETIVLNDKNTSTWEGTYGPVPKGFEAQIICELGRDYNYRREFHARIYVSREKEPFVIKAEDTDTSINLTYKIDF